jgi:porin
MTWQRNGSPFKQEAAAASLTPADAEIALEWTYRAVLMPWLALQPDFQYIIHPGGLISRPNAVVIGLRSEIGF